MWNLDEKHGTKDAARYCQNKGYDKNTHEKFKVGDVIQFMTGYNDDIPAQAKIKGINGDEIYVYNDCYWFPIKDTTQYNIKILGE